MTQVLLIPNPHTVIQKGRVVPEPYVPVGLLSIATVLCGAGVDVEILDINRMTADASYSSIPEAIAGRDPAILGFSTMCFKP